MFININNKYFLFSHVLYTDIFNRSEHLTCRTLKSLSSANLHTRGFTKVYIHFVRLTSIYSIFKVAQQMVFNIAYVFPV